MSLLQQRRIDRSDVRGTAIKRINPQRIFHAVRYSKLAILNQFLTEDGVSPNIRRTYLDLDFFTSSPRDSDHVYRKLMEIPNNVPLYGESLLFFSRHPDITKRLIEAGTEVDAVSSTGATALHYVIASRAHRPIESSVTHVGVVKALLEAGANPNVRMNFTGNTPLHLAVTIPHVEWTKTLVDGGAHLFIKNDSGDTPLDLAKKVLRRLWNEDYYKNMSPIQINTRRRELKEHQRIVELLTRKSVQIQMRTRPSRVDSPDPFGIDLVSELLHRYMGN